MVTTIAPSIEQEALDSFIGSIRGRVLTPGDLDYEEARHIRNGLIERFPAVIVQCSGTADVVDAVNFARDNDMLLSVRGGGHNVAGNAVNDGGLVIDLSNMRAVSVDPERRRVRAQGGATWGDFDRETQLFGLATTGGAVSSTGIGGLTLHGGLGYLHRKFGLALDNLRSVEIVTADGQVRTASESENPELFWAVRGAGSNFGVVTSFEFELYPIPQELYSAVPFFSLEDAPAVLRKYRDFAESAPDDFAPAAIFWSVPAIPDFPEELHGTPIVAIQIAYTGDPAEGEELLKPVFEWGAPLLDLSGAAPYIVMQNGFDPFFPAGWFYYWKSLLLKSATDDVIDTLTEVAATRPSPQTLLNFWQLGGAISRVPADATAYVRRDAGHMLSLDSTWTDPADTERCIAWVRQTWSSLQEKFGLGGAYLNFAGFGEEKEALVRASYGQNYDRLADIKRRYDPGNLFRMNNNIKPN
jgi:FAD/FMN-containing dehydrogenase